MLHVHQLFWVRGQGIHRDVRLHNVIWCKILYAVCKNLLGVPNHCDSGFATQWKHNRRTWRGRTCQKLCLSLTNALPWPHQCIVSYMKKELASNTDKNLYPRNLSIDVISFKTQKFHTAKICTLTVSKSIKIKHRICSSYICEWVKGATLVQNSFVSHWYALKWTTLVWGVERRRWRFYTWSHFGSSLAACFIVVVHTYSGEFQLCALTYSTF